MNTEERLVKGILNQAEKQADKGMEGKGLTVRAMEAFRKGEYQDLLEGPALAFRMFRYDTEVT